LTTAIQRILLVRTDRLGDVLLTLPVLPLLRAAFPSATIELLLRRYTGEIVEGNRYVDGLLWYDEGDRLVPFGEMLRRIRKERFDAVVVVHPTWRLALLMFLARIPLRVGTGYRYYSVLFNSRVFEHRRDARRHEVEYNVNLLGPLGCRLPERLDPAGLAVEVPREADLAAGEMLKQAGVDPGGGFVVIHPGSGGSAREWPLENLGKLASRLAQTEGRSIVVTGGKGEEALAVNLVGLAGSRAVSLAGKCSLKVLAALLRRADLCIAHSTGPLHLAVAVGTPVVGLYSQLTPMSPRRWGPYAERARVLVPDRPADCQECSPPRTLRCACMESITVEEVYRAAKELLASPAREHTGSSS
jgi:ADP-heptose:LPS heptosyltransferase